MTNILQMFVTCLSKHSEKEASFYAFNPRTCYCYSKYSEKLIFIYSHLFGGGVCVFGVGGLLLGVVKDVKKNDIFGDNGCAPPRHYSSL